MGPLPRTVYLDLVQLLHYIKPDSWFEVMPKIKDFGACRIEMYFGDHPPPHFHIVTPNGKVVVRIEDTRIIAGRLRRRVIADALKWAKANKAVLMERWNKYSEEERE